MRRKTILCELLLARIDLLTGEHAPGAGPLPEAIATRRRSTRRCSIIRRYFLKGQIEEALGDPASRLQSYQIARERLEALRSVLWGEDLKIAFMKTKLAVYERLVDLCLRPRRRRGTEIFGYIEQAKSRSLRDLFFERAGARSRRPTD